MQIDRPIFFPVRLAAFFRKGSTALLLIAAVLLTAGLSVSSTAWAAEKAAKKTKKNDDDPNKIPDPEDTTLETADGVQLAATYYASLKGKQAIPVVLLHGLKHSRTDFTELAKTLQSQGYAVLTVDLRGHGESKWPKEDRKSDNAKVASMPAPQFSAMVTQDMQEVKKFLREKNNDGELNIDKLCLVGAEMGAAVAVNFAIADVLQQNANPVQREDYKLGGFVKALVLLSPETACRGLPIRAATVRNIPDVAMLLLVGKKDSKAFKDAERFHGMVERDHPEPPTGDDKLDKQTLFFGKLDTSVQGAKLLEPNLNVPAIISDFFQRRLVKNPAAKEWGWRARQVPYN